MTEEIETPDTFTRVRKGASGLTVDMVLAALQSSAGIKKAAAMSLGVSRSSLYRFIDANPEILDAISEIDEEILDLTEGEVIKAIKKGDMNTARWFMDRKGRGRGYGHETTIQGGDKPIRAVVESKTDWSQLPDEVVDLIAAATASPDEHES